MLHLLSLLWALLAALPGGYADAAAAAWQDGRPVYVSPESGALSTEDAAALTERIDGWRDDVFVAVLPAVAIRQGDGTDADEASALIDDLYFAMGRRDGIYLVNASGAGTYVAGYGDAPGAQDVARILAEELDDHTLGQVDQVLDGTLDELGAPGGGGGGGLGTLVVGVLIGAAVVGAGVAAYVLLRRRPRRQPGGETWGGAAPYRPSFPAYGDQQDTVEERAALAREDVTRLGEELDAADPDVGDPAVGAHVQAALDAYADASGRVDALTTDDELRRLSEVTEYARWQLACAQAALAHATPPARRVPCFVDAAHGVSVADVTWAPPGGVARPVPVCRACFDRITGSSS